MRPDNSEYSKEVSVEEAALAYQNDELVVLRFHDGNDWYAARTQCKSKPFCKELSDITLDMLPHIRFFVKG